MTTLVGPGLWDGGRRGSPGRVFVIAEAGVNHNGDPAVAHRLIDVAADCRADAVKFQTFDPDALVAIDADAAPYQRNRGATNQLDMLRSLTLPNPAWTELAAHAVERGMTFLSTAFDPASLDLVLSLGVQALKVPSGELDNLAFIEQLASVGLPIIISTGLGTLDEVAAALAAASAAPSVALLHCVTAYPCPIDQSNLLAIATMREAFGVEVGWSDHTEGAVTAIAAVALGAAILEKHLTMDRTLEGPDHAASVDPEGFAAYVRSVREAESALGDGVKVPAPAEEANRHHIRRSFHTTREVVAGQRITSQDVILLRPADGLPSRAEVVNRAWRVARFVPVRLLPRMTSSDVEGRRRIALFTSSRADLGPLGPVIAALDAEASVELVVIATGTHSSGEYGGRFEDIQVSGDSVVSLVDAQITGTEPADLAEAYGRITSGVSSVLAAARTDFIVLLGDRWELLAAASAALLHGVPIAHLHGGEVTEGAMDERIRHGITKLADLHLCATVERARRIRHLGEEPWRIVVTGAPGLDRMATITTIDDARLQELLGVAPKRPFGVVVYHPPTVDRSAVALRARAVLDAAAASLASVLVLYPVPIQDQRP